MNSQIKVSLTALEKRAFIQLFDSSSGNGHDFGFTDELELDNKRQNGAVIASICKKGLITIYPNEDNNNFVSQFVFTDLDQAREILKMIKSETVVPTRQDKIESIMLMLTGYKKLKAEHSELHCEVITNINNLDDEKLNGVYNVLINGAK